MEGGRLSVSDHKQRERKRVTEAGMRMFEKGRKHTKVRLLWRKRRMRARRRRRKAQFVVCRKRSGRKM